jgi:hypothetical protein
LTDRAKWVGQLKGATDSAGFIDQRAMARQWFEDILQRHYRSNTWLNADYNFVPGISFGGRWAAGMQGVPFRPGTRSGELQNWLDADRLDVTGQVVEAVACYAISLIAETEISPTKDPSQYAQFGTRFAARADSAVAGITAELDTDGDGVNDVWIRLGIADQLEG